MSARFRLSVAAGAAVMAAGVGAISLATASPTGAAAAPAGGVEATVSAGPPLRTAPPGVSKQADALAFFPRVTTVVAGQSVRFEMAGFHTVTFASPKAFPTIVNAPAGTQPLLKDASGRQLWWAGTAPLLSLNPKAVPQLGGATISSPSQVRSSGLLRVLTASPKKPPKPYVLTFQKPGTYRFFCIVHPGMQGVIRVLPATATPPSVGTAEARGQTQLAHVLADIKSIQSKNPTEKLAVWVGTGKLDGAEVTSFFPKQLTVNTGDTVKFVSHDPVDIHTVTFGPNAYTGQIEKTFTSPKLVVNPFGAFPSEPPGPPAPVAYDGSNHGNGYLSGGVLYPYSTHQTPHLFRVTFTKPGTYHYECVIHQHMDGTIVVR